MRRALAVGLVALLLLPLAASANAQEPLDVERQRTGGHAILLEQYTATWCEVCATIDPWMDDFVADHGGRVERIALHPDDHDPFGTPLTTTRIIELSPDESLGLPTFWFDGQGQITGQVTYNRLSGAIMSAESDRSHWLEIDLAWSTTGNTHLIRVDVLQPMPEHATVTLYLKQTREMTSEIASNGVEIHDDVLAGKIVLSDTESQYVGNADLSVTADNGDEGIMVEGNLSGVVAVIEANGEILGVLGLDDEAEGDSDGFLPSMAIIFLLSALVLSSVILRRGSSD